MTPIPVHGCKLEPIGSYLKALGLLRLLATQEGSPDPDCRGYWKNGVFFLESDSDLKAEKVVDFLIERYAPTPILSPWNADAGFLDASTATFTELAKLGNPRLDNYCRTAKAILDWAEFPKTKNELKEKKNQVALLMRNRLDDYAVEWVDAVLHALPSGEAIFSPLLISGGVDGRFEFSTAFAKALRNIFGAATIDRSLVLNAIFEEPTSGFVDMPSGYFDPGAAGGYNQGTGIEAKSVGNPWNTVLMMEGIPVWSTGVALRSQGKNSLVTPFHTQHQVIGHSTAAQGDADMPKGEVWAPVWRNPAPFSEIKGLFSEGRAEVGGRLAKNSTGFAQAVSTLGVDRGIEMFVRHLVVKRRGKSYAAVPANRIRVERRFEADLVEGAKSILRTLKLGVGEHHPASFGDAFLEAEGALFDMAASGGGRNVLKALSAFGRLERVVQVMSSSNLASGKSAIGKRPSSGITTGWLFAASDCIELRLAASLAFIQGDREAGIGPFRANLEPVDPVAPWKWAVGDTQEAWKGHSLPARLTSVLRRRMIDAERGNALALPLRSMLPLRYFDVLAFLQGDIDDALLENLLFGCLWIRRSEGDAGLRDIFSRWGRPFAEARFVPREYAALKALFHGARVGGRELSPEPSVLPMLSGNRTADAVRVAVRRLRSSELNPVDVAIDRSTDGMRLAAALIFPLRKDEVEVLLSLVTIDNQSNK